MRARRLRLTGAVMLAAWAAAAAPAVCPAQEYRTDAGTGRPVFAVGGRF